VIKILFEDKKGRVWTSEEVNQLSEKEVEELGMHVYLDD